MQTQESISLNTGQTHYQHKSPDRPYTAPQTFQASTTFINTALLDSSSGSVCTSLLPRWLSSEGCGSYKDQLSTLSDLYGTVFFLATPCALNLTLPSFWKAHFQRVLWKHTLIQSSLLSSQSSLCALKCLCLLYAKCVFSIIFQAPGSRDLIIYSF